MKRLIGVFLFYSAIFLYANGSVNTFMVQGPDTLDGERLIKVNNFKLEIIPPSSGIQFYRDGILFLSHTKNEAKMLESHTSFGTTEVYYAVHKDTSIGNPVLFSQASSWLIPCEALTFNKDYSLMYFTKRPSNKEKEKIFQAKYQISKNGKRIWISDDKPLSFCSGNSVYSHPTLSISEDKMIYASDRSGSIGGLDLFVSYKEGNGWSSPSNLGNIINTTGNELCPFLDHQNNLFFSSDGIGGFGGYDIYFCRYNGNGWDKPVNLSEKINTPDDEIAFTLNPSDGKSGFFTTRYKTGFRSPKLSKVTLTDHSDLRRISNLSDAFKFMAQLSSLPAEEMPPDNAKLAEADITDKKTAPEPSPSKHQPPSEIKKSPEKLPADKKPITVNEIIYRVQFLSNSEPKGSYNLTAGGETYQTFEYLYNGMYRSCIGEFNSLSNAGRLQTIMKQEGFKDAFVVAFRNNERLTGNLQSIVKQDDQSGIRKTPELVDYQDIARADKKTESTSDDPVVYRVQYSSNSQPKGSFEMTIGGNKYTTFEYFYKGAYRSCIGEFNSAGPAVNLQKLLKEEGYTDSFVVTFRGNERLN